MANDIRQKRVCISGLGFIGLPTACILATSGYSVLGMDIDPLVVRRVQSANLGDSEPNLKPLLETALKSGHLEVSTHTAPADIHIIAVPTPLGPGNQPNLSHLHAAVDAIVLHLRPHDLVLIESTSPIGTTEAISQKIQNICPSVHFAYCPERVLPGNILHELVHNDRVLGGVDEASTLKAVAFYQSFIQGDVFTSDVRTAEAVKLAENTYRDINIAYANELSMIADHIGLDVRKLIRLANRHPRVQILEPGPGVGGHCIALNPWFLVSSAPSLARLISKAREVNTNKTDWVVQKIRTAIKENGARVIACLGLTYKPNVADIRESPALAVIQALEKEIEVLRVDPYLPHTDQLYEALERAEIVVGLVAHRTFLNIPSHCLAGKVVLDFAGIFE